MLLLIFRFQFVILLFKFSNTFVANNAFYPFIVDQSKNYLSDNLLDFKEHLIDNKVLYLNLNDLILKLNVNHDFFYKNAIIETRNDPKMYLNISMCCYFYGEILNVSQSSLVAISICNNQIKGFFSLNNKLYLIEPEHKSMAHSIKYLNVSLSADRLRSRARRSISKERNVETLLVVDKQVSDKFEDVENLQNYLLTIMNMVSNLYRESSLENLINIIVVRVIILENEPFEIVVNASATLENFCSYQHEINYPEGHPNHHDLAVFITSTDLCANSNTPCDTLGLARMGSVCDSLRSCNINEDSGLSLAFTIAHEMGHNFNAEHDSEENGCAKENEPLIMNTHMNSFNKDFIWSNCSRKAITKYLDTANVSCLNNKPQANYFKEEMRYPPGVYYDLDQQCQLAFGSSASHCNVIMSDDHDECGTLWCRLVNQSTCTTKTDKAADGTPCKDKLTSWCINSKCVPIEEPKKSINGEWGRWSDWSDCNRDCGIGIQYSQRDCNNPPPSYGGKYCTGDRKRYKTCIKQECNSTDEFEHQNKQCEKMNKNSDAEYLGWEYYYYKSNEECKLVCKPKGYIFFKVFNENLEDGTKCHPFSNDICIDGICRRVGCDGFLDSNKNEDICGVCGGDNSTCTMLEGVFQVNLNEFFGYHESLVVPKGARSIRIEEKAILPDTGNYLALKDSNNNYLLNGDYKITSDTDIKFNEVTIKYEMDSNLEIISSRGPLTEDLYIMLLYLGHPSNISYEYTIANKTINSTTKKDYTWIFDEDWTACNKTCGKGFKKLVPKCFESNYLNVNDSFCDVNKRPYDKYEQCNVFECPPDWFLGEWQPCSAKCEIGSVGYRKRSIICAIRKPNVYNDSLEIISVSDLECQHLIRPTAIEECAPINLTNCKLDLNSTSSRGFWVVEKWSDECKKDICSTETRVVKCSDPNSICDVNKRPISERKCHLPENFKCGRWKTKPWSECNSICDQSGKEINFRTRQVECIGGDMCNSLQKPHSNESCLSLKSNCETNEEKDEIFLDLLVKMFKPIIKSGVKANNKDESQEFFVDLIAKIKKPKLLTTTPKMIGKNLKTGNKKTILKQPNGISTNNIKESFTKSIPANKTTTKKMQTIIKLKTKKSFKVPKNERIKKKKYQRDIVIDLNNETISSLINDQLNRNNSETSLINLIMKLNKQQKFKLTSTTRSTTRKATTVDINSIINEIESEQLEYDWEIGSFGPCSRSCGGGFRARKVVCRSTVSYQEATDMMCLKMRPKSIEKCNNQKCLDWEVTEWSSCSQVCGHGFQERKVFCNQSFELCDPYKVPVTRKTCYLKPCYEWMTDEWSNCSVNCGLGVKIRKVYCFNHLTNSTSDGCVPYLKPQSVNNCMVNEFCTTTTTTEVPDLNCTDEFSKTLCRKVFYSNRCNDFVLSVKCCKTCTKLKNSKFKRKD